MKIAGIVYGRDDAQHLHRSLLSMLNQTVEFTEILYVDDASIDNSVEIAENLKVTVIHQPRRHEPWHGNPEFSMLPNLAIHKLHDIDYFLVSGADITLEATYVEKLLHVTQIENAVLSSGTISGQGWRPDIPKGAGRLHEWCWWHQFIKEYPRCYGWEALPIYLAQAYGYKTLCTPEAKMTALRPTKFNKPSWGAAMKQLGYFPPWALLRCAWGFIKHPRSVAKMLIRYIFSPCKPVNKKLLSWLRYHQALALLKLIKKPWEIRRILRSA